MERQYGVVGYDIGIDNRQYAIFQLKPELISQTMAGEIVWYWLKTIVHSQAYAGAGSYGQADRGSANAEGCVRPRFLID